MSYQVAARLGRGGSGVVDLAVDATGRSVAVKRVPLTGDAGAMEAARRRVRREADALTRLHHPNIVPLLEVADEGDDVVLVMPYLAGGTLARRVHEHGPVPPDQLPALAAALLSAMAEAHRQGVVHRDVKPANVLFTGDGTPMLADFGVARLAGATDGLTATGMVVGTPEFMAPEQARGEPATAASDVFALGATLVFAATGRTPWGTGDPRAQLLRATRDRPVAPPATLDPALRRMLTDMLARRPDRRPTAAHLVGGPAGTLVAPTPRRRHRVALAGVTLALLAAAVGLGAAWRQAEPAPDAAAGPVASTDTSACVPLPYQPCGGAPAPGTDGTACVDDRADYDADPTNGCEAQPDAVDGQTLSSRVSATLVPADDVDRYPVPVTDELHLFCEGGVTLSLRAPAGTTAELRVSRGDTLLDRAVADDDGPARVDLVEDCFADDSGTLTAEVRWIDQARSGEPYVLSRVGSL